MNKVKQALDSAKQLEDQYEFEKKRTEAREDCAECKPKKGYEDYSAEEAEDSGKEEIKPEDVEVKDHIKSRIIVILFQTDFSGIMARQII
jgi:Mg-chelatase subunit ChlD